MNIIYFDELNSTNTYAKENIDNLSDKTVISADSQTGGYGRFDRVWVDLGADNIFLSFVLKPSEKMETVYTNLTQYLSVCLCKELETFGLSPQIKWPNDVLLNGKKVCGILAEAVVRGGMLKGIVLGIGVNLNSQSHALSLIDRPATALNLEGINVDKNDFIERLVNSFFENYEEFLNKGFRFIRDDYEKFSIVLDVCKISIFNSVKEGKFAGFDNNGNIILETKEGKEVINMGEIV